MPITTQRQGGKPGPLRQRAQSLTHRLVAAQLLVALILTGMLAACLGTGTAYSVLVGATIAIVPNYYLAGRLHRRGAGATPFEALRAMYVGELMKFAFTVAMFVIAIRLLDIAFLAVVAGYGAMVAVNWAALMVIDLSEMPRAAGADPSRTG